MVRINRYHRCQRKHWIFSPSESCQTADLAFWIVDDYLIPGIAGLLLFVVCIEGKFVESGVKWLFPVNNTETMDKGCSRILLSLIVMFLPENCHCRNHGEAIQAST